MLSDPTEVIWTTAVTLFASIFVMLVLAGVL
jgi:hypothetical protein